MADNASLDLDKAITDLQKQLTILTKVFEKQVDKYVGKSANKLEAYMKKNRKWTDRSERARQGLVAKWEKGPTETDWKITLAHSVSYGVFLELAHEKKYAIIQPTILVKGPEVMSGFNKILEKAASIDIKL